MTTVIRYLWTVTVVLALPGLAPAQEVFREINSQRLEDILRSMNIQYTKDGDGKGKFWYDYKNKSDLLLRLTNYSGKDLMIDVFLTKVDWEVINKWNSQAKFSRARLEKNPKGEAAVLESNLDLAGSVTEETIKHFIRSFDLELARWTNKPIPGGGGGGGAPAPLADEEETYKNLSPERLEKILAAINVQYTKIQIKTAQGVATNSYHYDFTRNNFALRLTNYSGEDLMIDCIYAAAPLAKVNEWNRKRNYVRAVLYEGKGKPYTALESNLDCQGGTSDSIIRYFIEAFDGEVKAFDEYLKK